MKYYLLIFMLLLACSSRYKYKHLREEIFKLDLKRGYIYTEDRKYKVKLNDPYLRDMVIVDEGFFMEVIELGCGN